jgi:protein-S-isoprenylcysteine O-methyltransferase Ste14
MTSVADTSLGAARFERAYDYAERAFVTLLGLSIILRFLPGLAQRPFDTILLASECAAVAMVLFRKRARRTDLSPYAVAIALTGTTAGLLVRPGGQPAVPDLASGLVMITGALLSIAAKVCLNRSFGLTAANRGVKRTGPYRAVRHPMYAGYILTQIGFLLAHPTAWNAAVYAVAWSLQLLRITAEEKVLREDPAYRDYAAGVRARLIPGVY